MNSLTRHQFPGKIAPAACIVMLALVTATGAQEPTFRAQSNVVTVPVLVRDEHGQAVYGLHAADFLVQDDGVAQSIQMDEAVESEAISMVVALQTGRRAVREFPRMRGLAAMLNPIFDQPGSQIALVEFDSAVHLAQNFRHDSVGMDQAFQHLEPGDGSAAILDAVNFSVRLLEDSLHRGIDECCCLSAKRVITAAMQPRLRTLSQPSETAMWSCMRCLLRLRGRKF